MKDHDSTADELVHDLARLVYKRVRRFLREGHGLNVPKWHKAESSTKRWFRKMAYLIWNNKSRTDGLDYDNPEWL